MEVFITFERGVPLGGPPGAWTPLAVWSTREKAEGSLEDIRMWETKIEKFPVDPE